MAVHKEREIRMIQAERYLETMHDTPKDPCPEWIIMRIQEYTGNLCGGRATVEEALSCISMYRKEHKRRLVQIDRSDLLPFVQCVALQSYMESIQYESDQYDFREARKQFIELADQTLTACNMARFSEEYELDALLLAGFQENECYLYGEMLEEMGR